MATHANITLSNFVCRFCFDKKAEPLTVSVTNDILDNEFHVFVRGAGKAGLLLCKECRNMKLELDLIGREMDERDAEEAEEDPEST